MWFQLSGGFPASTAYRNANSVFSWFITAKCIGCLWLCDLHLVFCTYCLWICFQGDLNFESFKEMKNTLFLVGSCFSTLFLKWKKLGKHLVWQRFSLALPNSLNYRSKCFKLQWGGGKGEKQSFSLQYQTLQLWTEVRGMHMKSYFSQSWVWKLIATSAMKRLQPLHNLQLSMFFALPDLPL